MGTLGVVTFVVALLLSIALHELGHLLTAKRFGMKASRYFIGMGPTVWSTRKGETEYGVKAFPVGGFVKIVGMTQIEELDDPRDEPRAFWRFPAPQRAVVLGAGSFMHFVIAILVAYGALLAWGLPTLDTLRVDNVAECLTRSVGEPCAGKPPSPARLAGIKPGDRVESLDGVPMRSWQQFSDAVHDHAEGPATLVVRRGALRVGVSVDVRRVETETEPGVFSVEGRVGLSPGEVRRFTPVSAVPATASFLGNTVTGSAKALWAIPGKVPELFRDTAANKPRTVTGDTPVSVVDLGRFSGQAFEQGDFAFVAVMLASLNVFVGLFNLLPLLPLDGGHLAILGFEGVRSRMARALGRRDPGRVDLRRLMPAMVAFIVLLGSVSLVLLYAGIVNPIQNPYG